MGKLHVYEERTDRYLSYFKHDVERAKIIADIGCGPGTFSKALARENRLVIALDIDEEMLKEIKDSRIEKVGVMLTTFLFVVIRWTVFSPSHFLNILKIRRNA